MSAPVVISPHFDDAVLSCWSVLTASPPVDVLNVFTGAPPPGSAAHEGERLTGTSDPVARAAQRAPEDAEALALAGARRRNLGLAEHRHPAPGGRLARLLRGGGRRLRDAARVVTEQLDGDAHVYVPAGIGAHPDHVLVRELGCRLMRDGMRVSFYADQPYCYAYGWPHWVLGEPPDPHLDVAADWRRELGTASVDFDELRPEVLRLGSGHARKLDALRLYRTQFPVLEGGANRRVSNPELTGIEVFWHPPR